MPKPYSGIYYMCRSCNADRKRKYRQTKEGAEAHKKATDKYVNQSPEKRRARKAVANALKSGDIRKPVVCTDCLLQKMLDAHHSDYSKPLDVTWLCRQCHANTHKKLAFI